MAAVEVTMNPFSPCKLHFPAETIVTYFVSALLSKTAPAASVSAAFLTGAVKRFAFPFDGLAGCASCGSTALSEAVFSLSGVGPGAAVSTTTAVAAVVSCAGGILTIRRGADGSKRPGASKLKREYLREGGGGVGDRKQSK